MNEWKLINILWLIYQLLKMDLSTVEDRSINKLFFFYFLQQNYIFYFLNLNIFFLKIFFLAPSELYKCWCRLVCLSVGPKSLCIFSVYEGNRAYTIDGLIYPMMLINYWWKKLFLAAAELYKCIDGLFFFFQSFGFLKQMCQLKQLQIL